MRSAPTAAVECIASLLTLNRHHFLISKSPSTLSASWREPLPTSGLSNKPASYGLEEGSPLVLVVRLPKQPVADVFSICILSLIAIVGAPVRTSSITCFASGSHLATLDPFPSSVQCPI